VKEATVAVFERYLSASGQDLPATSSRELPAVLVAHLDARHA
jgi:hypothetical protein